MATTIVSSPALTLNVPPASHPTLKIPSPRLEITEIALLDSLTPSSRQRGAASAPLVGALQQALAPTTSPSPSPLLSERGDKPKVKLNPDWTVSRPSQPITLLPETAPPLTAASNTPFGENNNTQPFCFCSDRKRADAPATPRVGPKYLVYDALNGGRIVSKPPEGSEDDFLSTRQEELLFESRFEAGNLARAYLIGPDEYDLVLMPDHTSTQTSRWFYFSVTLPKMLGKELVRFNIVNMAQLQSLHGRGVQPVMLCSSNLNGGWRRVGDNLAFYSNSFTNQAGKPLYTFSFTLPLGKTTPDSVTWWIASSIPYTYTMLQDDLDKLSKLPNGCCMVREPLGTTSLGLSCDVLTITSPNEKPFSPNGLALLDRPGVVIMARVHASEAASSWVLKGFLEFLLSKQMDAGFLRDHVVFKIIPMVNPDGVVQGCTRADPKGVDLNRAWAHPDQLSAGCIHAAKEMIMNFCRSRFVVLSVDIHGNSKKLNSFMYACAAPGLQWANAPASALLVPRLMSLYSPTAFSYQDCSLETSEGKKCSARYVLWKDLKIRNSYTLEVSSGGTGDLQSSVLSSNHFNLAQYRELGKVLCTAVMDLWNGNVLRQCVVAQLVSPAAANTTTLPKLPDPNAAANGNKAAAAPPKQKYDYWANKEKQKKTSLHIATHAMTPLRRTPTDIPHSHPQVPLTPTSISARASGAASINLMIDPKAEPIRLTMVAPYTPKGRSSRQDLQVLQTVGSFILDDSIHRVTPNQNFLGFNSTPPIRDTSPIPTTSSRSSSSNALLGPVTMPVKSRGGSGSKSPH